MKKMTAYCGLDCSGCDTFIATKDDDDTKRTQVAKEWSKLYNADIKPEQINCKGCKSNGTELFNHCKVCDIRKCGLEKEVENCAMCENYICEKLENFFSLVPQCRELLDGIKTGV